MAREITVRKVEEYVERSKARMMPKENVETEKLAYKRAKKAEKRVDKQIKKGLIDGDEAKAIKQAANEKKLIKKDDLREKRPNSERFWRVIKGSGLAIAYIPKGVVWNWVAKSVGYGKRANASRRTSKKVSNIAKCVGYTVFGLPKEAVYDFYKYTRAISAEQPNAIPSRTR